MGKGCYNAHCKNDFVSMKLMVIKSKGYNDFINVTLVCDDEMVKAHKVLKTSKKKLILLLTFFTI